MYFASLPWLSDRPTLDELMWRPAWQQHAACRGVGHETFFPGQGGSTAAAKAWCARCVVRNDCSNYAVETGSSGVWAGEGRKPRYAGLIVSSGAA